MSEDKFGLDGMGLLKTPCKADAYSENLSKKEQKMGNSGTLAQEIKTGFTMNRKKKPGKTSAQLTFLPEDSPASRSQWPGSEKARKMTVCLK